MKVVSMLLAFTIAAAPAFAQQPVESKGKGFWAGAAVAIAGATVAILGTTAFKSEDTASGNTPKGAFQACEVLKTNPVYARNQCDVLKGPNLPMVWSGIGVAAAGIALLAVSASHSSIQVGPRVIRFQHRVAF